MAKSPAKWDVWFVAADQVYRGVPTDVAAGWAQTGRIGPADKLRPAGSGDPWRPAADVPGVGGFLAPPRPAALDDAVPAAAADLDLGPKPRRREAEDDDVDMIPLIDISLVLLVFFMMTTVVSVSSPVALPEMKYVGELTGDTTALVIQVEQRGGGLVYAVRAGPGAPAAGDADLTSTGEMFARLDAQIAARREPPAVRLAGQSDAPTDAVLALGGELDRRQKAGKIRSYTVDVNEAKR